MHTPAPVPTTPAGRPCRLAAGPVLKADRTPRPRASVPPAGEA
ncbi:hypothetical protein [Kitasatospora sp. NPDC094016]